MNITDTASYRAAPSRLMLVPIGMMKRTMLLAHPYSSAHFMATGILAALEDVPNPNSSAGVNFLPHLHTMMMMMMTCKADKDNDREIQCGKEMKDATSNRIYTWKFWRDSAGTAQKRRWESPHKSVSQTLQSLCRRTMPELLWAQQDCKTSEWCLPAETPLQVVSLQSPYKSGKDMHAVFSILNMMNAIEPTSSEIHMNTNEEPTGILPLWEIRQRMWFHIYDFSLQMIICKT